jgi:CMP-N-acetylneuraminic acid synthetase
MVVIGVVPARGGSKALPGKNLAMVAGRPLLAWTADAALAATTLGRVILSTDSPEIAAAGRSCGLDVPFLRPADLAHDQTPMVPVLQHVLAMLGDDGLSPDVLVLLQPTSPLRRAEHIDQAVERLKVTAADSVVSVVEVPHHFNPVSVLRDENGRLVPYGQEATVTRRQDKPRVFARNGPAVLAVRAEVIRRGSLYGDDSRAMLMTPEESIDIDSAWDLAVADWMLTRHR